MGSTDASGVAGGSFDAVLGGMLETPGTDGAAGALGSAGSGGSFVAGTGATEAASSEAASGRFVGSLQSVPGARHDRQRGIEVADDVASPTGRLDDTLSIRRVLPSSAQGAVEMDAAVVANPGVTQPGTPEADASAQPSAVVVHPSGGQGGAGIVGVGSTSAEFGGGPGSAGASAAGSAHAGVVGVGSTSAVFGGGPGSASASAAGSAHAGIVGVGSTSAVSGGSALAGSGADAVEATSGRFVGSLPIVPGARHDSQRGIEVEVSGAGKSDRLDDSLPIRRLLPSNAQGAVETGLASNLAPGTSVPGAGVTLASGDQGGAAIGGPGSASASAAGSAHAGMVGVGSTSAVSGGSALAGSGADAVEATSGRFVGSLPIVPGARHDSQRGIELEVSGAGKSDRLDDSLSIRRLLPSNAQVAVEMDTAVVANPGPAVNQPGTPGADASGQPSAAAVHPSGGQGGARIVGVGSTSAVFGGGALAGSGSDVEATSGRFVGSLQGVPGVRHDSQSGIELEVSGAGKSDRLNDSLSIRRLLPSSAQVAVEMDTAVVANPGPAVNQPGTPGADAAAQPSAAVVHPSGKAAPGEATPGQSGAGQTAQSQSGPEDSHHARAALDQAVLVQATPGPAAPDQTPTDQTATGQAAPDQAVLVQAAPGQTAPGQTAPVQPTQAQPANPAALHQQALNHPPLNHQLAQPLFALASAKPGEHVMTLRVSPEDLGPLTVRAHIDHAGVRIELFATGDAGREAVRHVLPELRRGLEDAGASLNLSSQDHPQDSPQDAPTDRGDHRPHEPAFQAPVPRSVATGREPEQPTHDPETNRLDVLV
ncbi:flagellar hook-length control protein FliK [Paenarthrobacter sp. NPDC089714]|uniref:flagellar hook-length control protein FliK n=1 Tax=Paenarthrobacter sp. NPDC089714 TaxID=3364377 RepID=UPI003806FCE6